MARLWFIVLVCTVYSCTKHSPPSRQSFAFIQLQNNRFYHSLSRQTTLFLPLPIPSHSKLVAIIDSVGLPYRLTFASINPSYACLQREGMGKLSHDNNCVLYVLFSFVLSIFKPTNRRFAPVSFVSPCLCASSHAMLAYCMQGGSFPTPPVVGYRP